jgi:hypothetical protein
VTDLCRLEGGVGRHDERGPTTGTACADGSARAAGLVGLGFLGCQALKGPTVPSAVVQSVRGDGIRIVDVEEASNTGSGEWTNTSLLIEVDGPDPVARLGSALAANGWTVYGGATQGPVLSADRKEARLTLITFAELQNDRLEVPKVLNAFERKGAGKGNLFVAVLMPY